MIQVLRMNAGTLKNSCRKGLHARLHVYFMVVDVYCDYIAAVMARMQIGGGAATQWQRTQVQNCSGATALISPSFCDPLFQKGFGIGTATTAGQFTINVPPDQKYFSGLKLSYFALLASSTPD